MSSYGKITSNPFMPYLDRAVNSVRETNTRAREKFVARKAVIDSAFEAMDRLKEHFVQERGWYGHRINQVQDALKEAVKDTNEEPKAQVVHLSSVNGCAAAHICQQLDIPIVTEEYKGGGRSTYTVNGQRVQKKQAETIEKKQDAVRYATFTGDTGKAMALLPTECRPDIQKIPEWRREMLEAVKQVDPADVVIEDDCERCYFPDKDEDNDSSDE